MSVVTIKSKCNLDTGSWTVDKTLLSHVSNEIGIGFENNSGTTVVFTNFSFYYKITDNADNSIIVEKSYPPTGIKYVESDGSFIVMEMLDLIPNHNYTLNLSATNNSKTYTETVTLNVPYPPKPFHLGLGVNQREITLLLSHIQMRGDICGTGTKPIANGLREVVKWWEVFSCKNFMHYL